MSLSSTPIRKNSDCMVKYICIYSKSSEPKMWFRQSLFLSGRKPSVMKTSHILLLKLMQNCLAASTIYHVGKKYVSYTIGHGIHGTWGWSKWRTEGCPVCPPWPPPRANMSNVWTAGILCVQICPPTPHYTPSSFFQTICTKDLDKGAQSDATVTSQNVSTRKQTLVAAKECVCALNENISFVSFFDQRKERFEGNIYNTPSLKPLMSKSL